MSDEEWEPLTFRDIDDIFQGLPDSTLIGPDEYLNDFNDDNGAVDLIESDQLLAESLQSTYGLDTNGDTEEDIPIMLKKTPGILSNDSGKLDSGNHDPRYKLDEPVLQGGKLPILLSEDFFAWNVLANSCNSDAGNPANTNRSSRNKTDDEGKSIEERFPTCFPNRGKATATSTSPSATIQNQNRQKFRAHLSRLGDIRLESIAISDSDDDDDVQFVSATESDGKSGDRSRSTQSNRSAGSSNDPSLSSCSSPSPSISIVEPKYYTPRELYMMKRKKN